MTPELHTPLIMPLPPDPTTPDSDSSSMLQASFASESTCPPMPLPWVWTCHICRSRYRMNVTHRCLNDGHVFCSGQEVDKQDGYRARLLASLNLKPKKRSGRKSPKACISEFDYVGWREWNEWRKEMKSPAPVKSEGATLDGDGDDQDSTRDLEEGEIIEDEDQDQDHQNEDPAFPGCEGCNFPCECRYKRFKSSSPSLSPPPTSSKRRKTSLDDQQTRESTPTPGSPQTHSLPNNQQGSQTQQAPNPRDFDIDMDIDIIVDVENNTSSSEPSTS